MFYFFTVSYKNKEECCSLYLLTSPVLVMFNLFEIGDLVNALRMETNHKTKNTSAGKALR